MHEQPGPQAPSSPHAVPAPPPRNTGKVILIVLAAVLLLCCCGGGLVAALRPDAVSGFLKGVVDARNRDMDGAKVGDCVSAYAKLDDARVVDCASEQAVHRVVGVLVGRTETQIGVDTLCTAFPPAEYVVWIGREDGRGDAWCLAPVTK